MRSPVPFKSIAMAVMIGATSAFLGSAIGARPASAESRSLPPTWKCDTEEYCVAGTRKCCDDTLEEFDHCTTGLGDNWCREQ